MALRTRRLLQAALSMAVVVVAAPAMGQAPQAAAVSAEEMASFARAHAAISTLREKAQAELAEPKNKKGEVMVQIREKLRTQVLQVLKENQMSEARFDSLTHLVSVDPAQRKAFEAALAAVARKDR